MILFLTHIFPVLHFFPSYPSAADTLPVTGMYLSLSISLSLFLSQIFGGVRLAGGIFAALSACLLLQPFLPPGSPASFSSPAVHNGTGISHVFISLYWFLKITSALLTPSLITFNLLKLLLLLFFLLIQLVTSLG